MHKILVIQRIGKGIEVATEETTAAERNLHNRCGAKENRGRLGKNGGDHPIASFCTDAHVESPYKVTRQAQFKGKRCFP